MITYFIQSGEFVKIGRTKNLQRRIDYIRVGFPENPILLNACDMPEKIAHKIADQISHRANGEWFKITPKLIDWISAIETTTDEMASYRLRKRTPKLPRIKSSRPIGRPATGATRTKLSVTVPIELAAKAKAAAGNAESLSQFVSRALQAALKP